MKSFLTQLERWRTQDLRLLPPEPEHRVVAAFARFGVRPSAQVVHMYSLVGGFEVPDANEWRLWPLDEIAASVPESPNEFGIHFADYMHYTSFFLLRPAPQGEMEVLHEQDDAEAPEIIAPNLSAFFDTYLAKPLSLIDPDAATSRYP